MTPGERMRRAGVDPLPVEQIKRAEIRAHAEQESILTEALGLVTGDRNAAYGPPEIDHARAGRIFAELVGTPASFGAVEAELFMLAIKLARMGHHYRTGADADAWHDSIVDLAGYAHCLARGLAAERPGARSADR